MHDNDPVEGLGLTCPYGSAFYICQSDPNRFIGCCGVNPCGARKGLCPDQHLHKASFDKAYEEYILPQACINDNVDVAWHSCSWSTSSFMGCCAVDPCSEGGCPSRELRAAKLSDNAKNAGVFLDEGYWYSPEHSLAPSPGLNPATSMDVSSITAIITAISSFQTSFILETTASTDTFSVSTITPGPESHDHHKKHHCLSTGGLVAIILVLIVVVGISAFCWWWKRRSRKNREEYERSQESNRESNSTHSQASSDDEWVRASDPLPEQNTRPETAQAMNHSQPHQVPQMFQPYISRHGNTNQPHGLTRTPEQVSRAQQRKRRQTQATPKEPSISPTTKKDIHTFLNAGPLGAYNPRPISERRGRSPPPPIPPPASAPPALFTGPDTENGNGSPTPYLPPEHGNLRIANRPASDRSSGTSKFVSARSTVNTSEFGVPLGLDPNPPLPSHRKNQTSGARAGR